MTDKPARRAFRFLAPALLLLLAGCRTYGSYDSPEKLHAEIVQANQAFADELARRQADAEALAEVAAYEPSLASYAEQFGTTVLAHEAVLGEAQNLAAEVEGSTHRALKRSFGAVVMNQQSIQRQYQAILDALAEGPAGTAVQRRAYEPMSRYFAVPPYYQRVRHAAAQPSLQTALRRYATRPAADMPAAPGGAAPADTTAAPQAP